MQEIAAAPGEHRVLNSYNTAGLLLRYGGPRTTVAIDGRADLWGAARIDAWVRLGELRPGWEATLAGLDRPTDALLFSETPLVAALQSRGWTVADRDGDYTWLRAPGSTS